ncbi:MAG: FecR family protein [Draconibacterium sp.]
MKNLFKKYYNSVLGPGEFSEVAGFLGKQKNDFVISGLMKSFWKKEIEATEASSKQNPALFSRIKEVISIEQQRAVQRKMRIYVWGLRVAAVLLIALIAGNIYTYIDKQNKHLVQQIQSVTTPYGARTQFSLPDGSIVWLNSGSTLSYPMQFDDRRPVKLEGEAFFEVVKGDSPFIVSTGYGNVAVKGTSFNVKAYSDDNVFETTLVEGSVKLTDKNALNEVTLKPGELGTKNNYGFTVEHVETAYYTSWKEGKLLFNREPFPSFIKKLERWYNVKIEYNDPGLNELWYTGTIEMESISEVMEMISKAAPLTYSFNNKTRVFTIRKK